MPILLYQDAVALCAKENEGDSESLNIGKRTEGQQIGGDFEATFFECLRHATDELQVKNTVVFTGLNLKDVDSKTLGEIDFLIFSDQLKAVIQVTLILKFLNNFDVCKLRVLSLFTQFNIKFKCLP